jgi:hypothetical protein
MPSATKPQPVTLDDIVVAHRQRARDLVLAYARGEEVSPEEFIAIAQQSGRGVYWLQTLAETVAKGKRLFDEHHGRDFAGQMEAAKAERNEAQQANTKATEALTAAREAAHAAAERYTASVGAINRVQQEQTLAADAYRKAMKEIGVDHNDWENFSMG